MKKIDPLKNLTNNADLPGMIGPFDNKLALVTHKFSTTPIEFGGTCSGSVAVNHVVNTLLSYGATPRYLAICFTVSSAVGDDEVKRLAEMTSGSAVDAEAEIAAVDAIVVGSDMPSGVQIAITGLGEQRPDTDWGASNIRKGDSVIVTGAVGAHGAALAQARSGNGDVKSDSAPLNDIVHAIQNAEPRAVRAMVYPFGGFNAAISALEEKCGMRMEIDIDKVPVAEATTRVAEMMGVSPLDLETAGAMVMVVDSAKAADVLATIRRTDFGSNAAIVGIVHDA